MHGGESDCRHDRSPGSARAVPRSNTVTVAAPSDAAEAPRLRRVLNANAPESPAEVLRSQRAVLTDDAARHDQSASGTRLAYQFFGHPNLRLTTTP